MDVAAIPVMIIVGHVEGRRAATTQPEHIPSRWCPGLAGRSAATGDKVYSSK